MNNLSQRQRSILGLARQNGDVMVDDLAHKFGVTPQTIRRDLNELCDAKLLARTHGGAMLSSGVENMAYESRRIISAAEKKIIGQRAAAEIPNNCSLFINIGTTTEEVARALVHHEGLLVITNNIHVATILMPCPRIDVIMVGGNLRRADGGIVGETAVETIKQFKVDYGVIGASAIDDDGSLLDFDFREVRASQAILSNSRHIMLVADSMKFSRSAPVRIGHISEVDVFVTDRPPPDSVADACRHGGVRIETVGNPEETHSLDAAE